MSCTPLSLTNFNIEDTASWEDPAEWTNATYLGNNTWSTTALNNGYRCVYVFSSEEDEAPGCRPTTFNVQFTFNPEPPYSPWVTIVLKQSEDGTEYASWQGYIQPEGQTVELPISWVSPVTGSFIGYVYISVLDDDDGFDSPYTCTGVLTFSGEYITPEPGVFSFSESNWALSGSTSMVTYYGDDTWRYLSPGYSSCTMNALAEELRPEQLILTTDFSVFEFCPFDMTIIGYDSAGIASDAELFVLDPYSIIPGHTETTINIDWSPYPSTMAIKSIVIQTEQYVMSSIVLFKLSAPGPSLKWTNFVRSQEIV